MGLFLSEESIPLPDKIVLSTEPYMIASRLWTAAGPVYYFFYNCSVREAPVSMSSSSASAPAGSSASPSTPWEPPNFGNGNPWDCSPEELLQLGYPRSMASTPEPCDHFRPWNPDRFNGCSKLYTDAWKRWSQDVRQSQYLAEDNKPYNDNPVPVIADGGDTRENQDMTAKDLPSRVFGRNHNIVYRVKTIIMDGTSHQMEIAHGEPPDKWPSRRQPIMEQVADMNYYGDDCEDWSYAATVVSSSVRGDTFMSPMHTNPLKPGRKDPGLVQWISASGSVVDDLATTKKQMEKIVAFGSKVIVARHGPDVLGDDGPSQVVLFGEHFNDKMLEMLDQLKDKVTTSSPGRVPVPRLFRLIVVNANGFSKGMADRLFGEGKVFEGRVPVRQFTDLKNPGKELEVVVFPVSFSTFWDNQEYSHYTHNRDTIRTAYHETLSLNIERLTRKMYADKDLQQFVYKIWSALSAAEPYLQPPTASSSSAASSESHNEQEVDFPGLSSRLAALQRNVLQKSDLKKIGKFTRPAKLFEVGPCTRSLCTYAGPAGFGCRCGGYFTPHSCNIPKRIFRFANDFLDSDSDSDDSNSDDDSAAGHKRKSYTSTGKRTKKPRNEAVEKLKKAYAVKHGNSPKGRFASDVGWLKQQLK